MALLNRIWPHCGQDASSVKSSQAWHLCGCFNARKTSGNELQALGLRFHFLWFVPAFLFEARLDSVHSDRLCPNHRRFGKIILRIGGFELNTVKSQVEACVTIQKIKSLGVLQIETCH